MDKAVKFLLAEHKAHPGQAIVITGHSLGAASAVEAAEKLGKAGVKVDLLLTIDPVFGDKTVSPNVVKAHNFFQNQESVGGDVVQPTPGSNTQVQNTLVVDTNHTSIDNGLATIGVPQKEIKKVGEDKCQANGGQCPP